MRELEKVKNRSNGMKSLNIAVREARELGLQEKVVFRKFIRQQKNRVLNQNKSDQINTPPFCVPAPTIVLTRFFSLSVRKEKWKNEGE